ncbi:hypothetical protein PCNPT3_09540 [Psychromonas sp. CNPT3]|uniref:hypothetical protein n=1 Tax=Psychromonas sp. CNPT3 TaxID=314282 RepID=UPI00006E913E|nr:hypothetical protein [Psychromonas sp. CNPT3]AGH81846.1 hypothetical protein PCNPT3_09540 [Psychromonas sp. CNPT3]
MHQIIAIAQQLSKEGKTPNTALIKARLPKNTPLPLIIEGLRSWRGDPHQKVIIEPLKEAPSTAQKDNLNTLIAQQIKVQLAPLITQINELKQRIKLLEESH